MNRSPVILVPRRLPKIETSWQFGFCAGDASYNYEDYYELMMLPAEFVPGQLLWLDIAGQTHFPELAQCTLDGSSLEPPWYDDPFLQCQE